MLSVQWLVPASLVPGSRLTVRQLGQGLCSLWIASPTYLGMHGLSRFAGSCLHHGIVSESSKGFWKCVFILVVRVPTLTYIHKKHNVKY